MKFKDYLIANVAVSTTCFFIMFALTGMVAPAIAFGGFIFIMYYGAGRYSAKNSRTVAGRRYDFMTNESIFNNSLLVLLAGVLKSDEHNSNVEVKYIQQSLSLHFNTARVDQQVAYIQKLTQRENLDHKPICKMIFENYYLTEKVQLMHLLVGIATADAYLSDKEKAYLDEIAARIRLPFPTYQAIFSMFRFKTEAQHREQQKRREQKQYSSSMKLADAFKILELELNATEKEIKKSYRKLALKFHPDRVIHLGKEHQKIAEQKFQILSEAYEYIKNIKGFN
ncbi:DnaJ domain-containing protein [Paracrocinitomix mangrovi]|uniref:DnaJ domain-containing protein n=1 Tax=Paracrocinitomix mangrovi TaxID=2862509 RepID=UPI001C8D5AE6|nr:DnaJ domain-containing protein [Paracrocinitomix mangrovi]UKN00127.1 DnaJ domain-containing protein [Paracrocinitomix mangrovi]